MKTPTLNGTCFKSYSFAGSPHVTGGLWDCARLTFFTQHANQFFTTEDKQLAAELDKALTSTQVN